MNPEVQSASARIANVDLIDPPGTHRLWEITLSADVPGTPCEIAAAPLAVIDVYTIFSSAPRGEITIDAHFPPAVFPAADVVISEATRVEGTVSIPSASRTGVFGTVSGYAALVGGSVVPVDIRFEAPVCTD